MIKSVLWLNFIMIKNTELLFFYAL